MYLLRFWVRITATPSCSSSVSPAGATLAVSLHPSRYASRPIRVTIPDRNNNKPNDGSLNTDLDPTFTKNEGAGLTPLIFFASPRAGGTAWLRK